MSTVDPTEYRFGQASIWVQPDGPNTKPEYLGCHELNEIAEPDSTITPAYCPDPGNANGFKVSSVYEAPATELPTTSIDVPIGPTLDYLEEWDCAGNLFIHKFVKGRRDLATNWTRAQVLYRARRGGRTYSSMAARDPDGSDERSMVAVPFTFEKQDIAVRLRGIRQTIAATLDLNVITFCQDPHCFNGGPRIGRCQYGVAAGAAGALVVADIYFTADGGDTWTITAADPFANNEVVSSGVYFPLDPDTRRVILGNGTAGAGGSEIAYSDDDGATWTNVLLSAVVGQYITALTHLDQYHIWATTDDGYIFKSEDGGATWTEYEAGVLTALPYFDIRFMDPLRGIAVGDANVVSMSVNGGRTWEAVVAPAAQAGIDVLSGEIVTARRWFLGYDDGDLYYTEDGGATWALRAFNGSGAGDVEQVRFEDEMIGYLIHNSAAPVGRVLRTKDGGYTWEVEEIAANDGLADIEVCGVNHAFIAGLTSGATAYVAEVASV